MYHCSHRPERIVTDWARVHFARIVRDQASRELHVNPQSSQFVMRYFMHDSFRKAHMVVDGYDNRTKSPTTRTTYRTNYHVLTETGIIVRAKGVQQGATLRESNRPRADKRFRFGKIRMIGRGVLATIVTQQHRILPKSDRAVEERRFTGRMPAPVTRLDCELHYNPRVVAVALRFRHSRPIHVVDVHTSTSIFGTVGLSSPIVARLTVSQSSSVSTIPTRSAMSRSEPNSLI